MTRMLSDDVVFRDLRPPRSLALVSERTPEGVSVASDEALCAHAGLKS